MLKRTSLLFGIFLIMSINLRAADATPDDLFKCHHELYGVNSSGPNAISNLFWLNPITGAGHLIGQVTGASMVTGIDFGDEGHLYGVGLDDATGQSALFRIHCETAVATLIGLTGAPGNITDISFREDGQLFAYVEAAGGNEVGSIDLVTGAYSSLGLSGSSDMGNGLSFHHDTLYLAGQVDLSTIDQSNGVASIHAPLTFFPPADANAYINSMDSAYFGTVMYVSINDTTNGNERNYLGVIDLDSGEVRELKLLGHPVLGPIGLDGIAYNSALENI